MPVLTLEQALHLAAARHQAGRFAEAEPIYRTVLSHEPENADALHLLGLLMYQTGRAESAVESIRHALRIVHDQPIYLANLALALASQRDTRRRSTPIVAPSNAIPARRKSGTISPTRSGRSISSKRRLTLTGKRLRFAAIMPRLLTISAAHCDPPDDLMRRWRRSKPPWRFRLALRITPITSPWFFRTGGNGMRPSPRTGRR